MRFRVPRAGQEEGAGRWTGTIASVGVHAVAVVAGVIATATPELPPPDSPWTQVIYLAPPEVPMSAERQTRITYVGIGGNSFENSSPAVDDEPGTEEALDTDREGVVLTTVADAPPVIEEEMIYLASQVQNPASVDPASAAPAYPEELRSRGVEGKAVVQFVVDASGLADTTSFSVLDATHQEFVGAVRAVLPRMRFVPGEQDGMRVRQLVEIPFTFKIQPPLPPMLAADSLPGRR